MSSPVMSVDATGRPVRVPVGGLLTPRMERLIRVGSVGSAIVIATCAMVLSYSGLLDLALDAQVHPRLALLVPIMVDGLQFVGSLGVVYSTLSGLRSWYPWILMLMGVTISAWGNWQAAPDDLTARLLHASAPIILALVLEELLRVMRHKVHLHNAAWLAEQEAAEDAAAAASTVPQTVVEPVEVPLPAATGDPDRAPEREPAPEVAAPVAVEPDPVVETEPVAGQTWTPREPILPVRRDPQPAVAVPAPQPVRTAPVAETRPVADQRDQVLPFGSDEEETLPAYSEAGTFKEQVKEILTADPEIPAAKIARVMRRDASYTRKIVREAKAELDEEAAGGSPAPHMAGSPSVAEPLVPAVASPVPAPVVEVTGSADESFPEDDFDDLDPFAVAGPTYAAR